MVSNIKQEINLQKTWKKCEKYGSKIELLLLLIKKMINFIGGMPA